MFWWEGRKYHGRVECCGHVRSLLCGVWGLFGKGKSAQECTDYPYLDLRGRV